MMCSQLGKVLSNWTLFPTGLVGLGLSWENKCIVVDIMYLQVI